MARNLDQLRAAITAHGDRRRAALATAETELDEIAKLAPRALAAGMTKVELSAIGAVSRPTLDAKLR
jgi:hypothetical protein